MLQSKELPKLSEGFSRIMFCHSKSDVQAAMDTYAALGALDTLRSGSFGQKKMETKVQLGLMKSLKKLDVPPNAGSSLVREKDSACPQISNKKDPSCKMPDNVSSIFAADHKQVKERDNLSKGTIGHGVSLNNVPTLALVASISTEDFKFNNDRASDIIVEKVEEFVKKLGNARLVLVDLSYGSKILSLVKAKPAQRNIDTKKKKLHLLDI
ncbi:transcription factor bHLH140-like [Euphorbia lathyris]|uniref:transcription factor bHLH140-like n=1 Tax=Euphorbia lathyris TaxID=212925 RepID=UPI00331334A4